VFEPINEHFRPNYHKEWAHDLSGPCWEQRKAFREDPSARRRGERPNTELNEISRGDDDEHQQQLEPFHDIGTEKLKEVLLFELLEDGGFNLDELYGEKERHERIGIRVYSYVKRDYLVEEHE
jgi:hypothetical protein